MLGKIYRQSRLRSFNCYVTDETKHFTSSNERE